ncbi:MAG: hypothetical protein IJY78_08340 [Bacteroidaceae bacterium]|nr:hypothetical protein [Bacteroidaceae bacterium]
MDKQEKRILIISNFTLIIFALISILILSIGEHNFNSNMEQRLDRIESQVEELQSSINEMQDAVIELQSFHDCKVVIDK